MNEEILHRRLASFNHVRLQPCLGAGNWEDEFEKEIQSRVLEFEGVEKARAQVADRASRAPTTSEAFLKWFKDLKQTGPGQQDALFPWLAADATTAQMRWFLTQEMAGEAGFDDLVAMTQVKLPERAKLELARNYWDEMGRGNREGQHGLLLGRLAHDLDLHYTIDTTVWESLALANLMTALAANRRYAYLSLGALGVIEMTSPGRVAQVNEGLKRLGVAASARQYFSLHSSLDVRHSESWNREVFGPLVAANPLAARPFAEGALLRLSFGARCFERYRRELGIRAEKSSTDHPSPEIFTDARQREAATIQ
jgi:hypothetical protein